MSYDARSLVWPAPAQLLCTVCEIDLLDGKETVHVLEHLQAIAELHYQRIHRDLEIR